MSSSVRSRQQSIMLRIVRSTATTRTPYMRCCQAFFSSRTRTVPPAVGVDQVGEEPLVVAACLVGLPFGRSHLRRVIGPAPRT